MIVIYHNPRCSKSREALAFLEAQGQPFQVVDYLKTPLDLATLNSIAAKLQQPVRELVRSKEPEFKALGLDNADITEQQLLLAIARHPRLLERPVVVKDNQAAIGRPLAQIAALFS